MAHDWGIIVPAELSTDQVMEILGELRDGTLVPEVPESLRDHPRAAEWNAEMQTQMLAAYEREAARRRS